MKQFFKLACVLFITTSVSANAQSASRNVGVFISNLSTSLDPVHNKWNYKDKKWMEDSVIKLRTKLGEDDTSETSFRNKLEETNSRLALQASYKSENKLTTLSGKKADNNKDYSFFVKYVKLEGANIKYGFHIEGHVKACEGQGKIPRAYVSLNSALGAGSFEIVPTNTDGWFSTDITDDSIASISLIKKGFQEKDIVLLNNKSKVNDSTSYVFDACLEKTDDVENEIVSKLASTSKAANVFFDFNKSALSDETKQMLDGVIENVKSQGTSVKSIDINGFTDKKGTKKYNLTLSKERSLACKQYLMTHGLNNVKINIKACGVDDVEVKDKSEMAKSRRVDIIIHKIV